jgi:hypothetical protein
MKPTTKVRKLQVLKKVVVENLSTTNPFEEKPRQTIPSTDITTKKSPFLYEISYSLTLSLALSYLLAVARFRVSIPSLKP